ncbi:D-2-hydroxyacid dehydrogenase [Bacillus sp. EAC]|uniref:D-2-hydroxyacid dehydrogenase n=1 Tax=Bacillus sp. EAC TaxID=1978338 RepID=UPI000B434690|nr:D-2-hydroxyacid dehydrogenase [Bacillus sp. EAC]
MDVQKILVTSRIQHKLKEIIESHNLSKEFRFLAEDEVTKEDYEWADTFVGFRPTPNFEFGNIKWVHSLAAGVDSFMKIDWKEDVLLTRTVDVFGPKMSQYCLSYILQDSQLHEQFSTLQAEKKWEFHIPKSLDDQKVVIFGTGEIGGYIGRTLSLLGMKVFGVSMSGNHKPFFEKVVSFQEAASILDNTDWVISVLPSTKETQNLINMFTFKNLNNAGFINVGRGATVSEDSLVEALQVGHVRKAILDVFNVEPLPKESVLWNMPNVTITPHISAVTLPNDGVRCFVDTLEKLENKKNLSNIVEIEKGY